MDLRDAKTGHSTLEASVIENSLVLCFTSPPEVLADRGDS